MPEAEKGKKTKITFVGPKGSGKTTLIQRLLGLQFRADYTGRTNITGGLNIDFQADMKMNLCECVLPAALPVTLRDASFVCLVVDPYKTSKLDDLDCYLKAAREQCPNARVIIMATHSDDTGKTRSLSKDQLLDAARDYYNGYPNAHVQYHDVSSKEMTYQELINLLISSMNKDQKSGNIYGENPKKISDPESLANKIRFLKDATSNKKVIEAIDKIANHIEASIKNPSYFSDKNNKDDINKQFKTLKNEDKPMYNLIHRIFVKLFSLGRCSPKKSRFFAPTKAEQEIINEIETFTNTNTPRNG